MPEPTSTAAATIASAMVSTSAITLLGIPLGLRADMLPTEPAYKLLKD